VEKITMDKIQITAIDIGGHKNVRKTWRNYFPTIDAIIYMIDAADPKRFQESKAELDYIL
jgi:GTP-binding protein SAR1